MSVNQYMKLCIVMEKEYHMGYIILNMRLMKQWGKKDGTVS